MVRRAVLCLDCSKSDWVGIQNSAFLIQLGGFFREETTRLKIIKDSHCPKPIKEISAFGSLAKLFMVTVLYLICII